jgi:hypothetical protein
MNRAIIFAAGISVAFPVGRLAGQDSLRASCPERGLVATFSTGAPSIMSSRTQPSERLELGASGLIDTTWRFDIRERTWSRPFFAASIGAGWTADGRTTGTTTAADASAARTSRVCAGVAIEMREPTLVLKGARGMVHLRADVRSLSGTGPAPDSTRQPRQPRR